MTHVRDWGLDGPTDAPRLLLTPREAAAALRVSERTLYTWARTGRLPRVTLGGCVRYDVADLRRLIDAAKTASAGGGGR